MWLRGRMAPFIELGVGFNPDLTAHDNVLLNAVMLGLIAGRGRERYDAIIDFAELREFQDLKLKNYSSGMQVRLAFAVMVHVDADLLLIDEVLAVGDAAFQQKCYDVLHQAKRERPHDPARDARHGPGPALLRPRDAARARRARPDRRAERRSPAATWSSTSPASHDGQPQVLELGPSPTDGARRDDRGLVGAGRRGPAHRGARAGRSCAMCMRVRFLRRHRRSGLRPSCSRTRTATSCSPPRTEWEEPTRRLRRRRGGRRRAELRQLVRSRPLRRSPGEVVHAGTAHAGHRPSRSTRPRSS